MKIILSPAKDMNLDKPIEKDFKINETTKQIIDILKAYNDEKLQKVLKIKGKTLSKVSEYYYDIDKKISYKAIEMYSGVAFKALDIFTLDKRERDYLKNSLVILSALYGPLSSEDNVKPYRLDFNTSIPEIEGSLESLKRDEYNNYFKEYETIFNLASLEFSKLLDREKFDIIDFDFLELNNGKKKKSSTGAKKARGLMVRFLAINNIHDIDKAKKFNLEGYEFSEEDSSENKLVFIKKD